MRALVDTHVMLWWEADDARLSDRARSIIGDRRNDLLWSVASSWEIAVKVRVGKLELGRPLARLYADIVKGQGVEVLAVGHDHCVAVAELPPHHRDPFDRMLVAQAQDVGVPILSADGKLDAYDVEVIWD